MKEYPVGTVCVVIGYATYPELVGEELTITGPLRKRRNGEKVWEGYDSDLVHKGWSISPQHKHLRPKKFPPNAAFDSFFNKLLQPCDWKILEEA